MLTLADSEAYAHAYRVAALSASVGMALQLREEDMASLERAALLHDVGKLAMPDAILRKPAPLTIEEQDLVRQHPQIAADLIAGVPYLAAAAELVRDAHERIDGLGYPNGTRAADVALGARIISVADAFDAMTRPRVFRDAITPGEALLELDAACRFRSTRPSSPPSASSAVVRWIRGTIALLVPELSRSSASRSRAAAGPPPDLCGCRTTFGVEPNMASTRVFSAGALRPQPPGRRFAGAPRWLGCRVHRIDLRAEEPTSILTCRRATRSADDRPLATKGLRLPAATPP